MTEEPDAQTAEPGSDLTRAGSPRIQPVLVGLVLATIIAAIAVAAFWVS
jgi:hypothetical protein